MSNYLIQSQTLTDIADAIRSKTGSSSPISGANMATEIENIPIGSSDRVRCYGNFPRAVTDRPTININLKAGDTIVFLMSHRSSISVSIPDDCTLIAQSSDGSGGSQYLSFIKYTALTDELKNFTFSLSAASDRFYLSFIILNNVSISYSGNYYRNNSQYSYDITYAKPANTRLILGSTSYSWNTSADVGWSVTPSDVIKIQLPDSKGESAPRQAMFFADSGDAENITISFDNYGTTNWISDAVEVTYL